MKQLIEATGRAEEISEIMMSGVHGSVRFAQAAWEDLNIAVFESQGIIKGTIDAWTKFLHLLKGILIFQQGFAKGLSKAGPAGYIPGLGWALAIGLGIEEGIQELEKQATTDWMMRVNKINQQIFDPLRAGFDQMIKDAKLYTIITGEDVLGHILGLPSRQKMFDYVKKFGKDRAAALAEGIDSDNFIYNKRKGIWQEKVPGAREAVAKAAAAKAEEKAVDEYFRNLIDNLKVMSYEAAVARGELEGINTRRCNKTIQPG